MHKLKDNLNIFHELAGPVFPPRELRSSYLVQVGGSVAVGKRRGGCSPSGACALQAAAEVCSVWFCTQLSSLHKF